MGKSALFWQERVRECSLGWDIPGVGEKILGTASTHLYLVGRCTLAMTLHGNVSQHWCSKPCASPDVLGLLSWREQALLRSGMLSEEKPFLLGERFW